MNDPGFCNGPSGVNPCCTHLSSGFGLLSAVGASAADPMVSNRDRPADLARGAQSPMALLPDKRPGPILRPDDGTSCRAGDGASRPKLFDLLLRDHGRITASLRASATFALRGPARRATASAQSFRAEPLTGRVNITLAASYNAVRTP
jgi:hypothetical protein